MSAHGAPAIQSTYMLPWMPFSAAEPRCMARIVSRFMLAFSIAFTCVSSVMRVPARRSSSFS